MDRTQPFVLLDDARDADNGRGAAAAHLYCNPKAIFIARRGEDVAAILDAAMRAQAESGGYLAGSIAYEAGLAIEPRLAHLCDARSGANGPLVWLGLFEEETEIASGAVPQWLAAHSDNDAVIGPLTPQLSTGGYGKQFEAMRQRIKAGDIYQVNLTYPLAGSYEGDPLGLYAKLRPAANAGYGGVIFDGSHYLISLSPELFVSLKEGHAKVKPMKGTRPRSADAKADGQLAEELANSVKDRAENLMIVDLMRNDLSRVAEAGSVRVEDAFAVETYPTVHQMVSTVHAKMQAQTSPKDLIEAIFPCGSITGAPKIRAMELIDAIESAPRGPYCGAMGRIDPNGNSAFNVAIRTVRLTPIENDRGHAVLGVGSAIVADSDPMAERRECEIKAGFVRKSGPEAGSNLTAARFDLIETMRFEPETGIALLELHLERMKASAKELGLEFDRHAARNAIHALCFDLSEPSKIRLLTARSGAVSLEASALPAPSEAPMICAALPSPIDPSDWRLRHKTSERAFYEEALRGAHHYGAQEAVLVREDGFVTEGSFTNIFVERDGVLLTPSAQLGLLPGVLRRSLLDNDKAKEAELTLDDLTDGFLLGNSVRGLFAARLLP